MAVAVAEDLGTLQSFGAQFGSPLEITNGVSDTSGRYQQVPVAPGVSELALQVQCRFSIRERAQRVALQLAKSGEVTETAGEGRLVPLRTQSLKDGLCGIEQFV